MENVIPYRRMKRVLKQYIQGEITHESILCVRDALSDACRVIATEVLLEFEEYNKLRAYHGIPKLKRIPTNLYLKVLSKYLSIPTRFNTDELGQYNRETCSFETNKVVE